MKSMTAPAGKAFFDTNILLYMYGGGDAAKTRQAAAMFAEYSQQDRILLSTQVLQEFYAVALRKVGMPRPALRAVFATLLDLPLVLIDRSQIRAAVEYEERYQISFWDALIVGAAESGGADLLFTEDLNHGQRYGAVMVQNPFIAGRT